MVRLIFLLMCLSVTIFVCIRYVYLDFHARLHRMLPMILVLLGVYDFYLVVEYISGATEVFLVLKYLLLMQTLCAVFWYILDFMRFRLPNGIIFLIMAALLICDVLACALFYTGMSYMIVIKGYVVLMAIAVVIVAAFCYFNGLFSGRERRSHHFLYLEMLLCLIAVVIEVFTDVCDNTVLPVAVVIMSLTFQYLMETGQLVDVSTFMKEILFDEINSMVFLFDTDGSYLESSAIAREKASQHVKEMEANPCGFATRESILGWAKSDIKEVEQQIEGIYYKCRIQEVIKDGVLSGYMVVATDIQNLKEENKRKSVFLAQMSHDLRSPLHAIIGGTEVLLSRNEMSMRNRSMVSNIHDEGQNLLMNVNAILDFSKMENKKMELVEQTYDFAELMQMQAYNMLMNLKHKDVEFDMSVETPYPTKMIGDEMRVREIVQNLLSNAAKFTLVGNIHARFHFFYLENNKVRVVLEVEDTGSGMTEDQMGAIFDDYVSYAEDFMVEGTGLGLSITRQLAELMNGDIRVNSMRGVGTTFTVSFEQSYENQQMNPPCVFDKKHLKKKMRYVKKEVEPEYVYPNANVLLVDDTEVNRMIFRDMVYKWEFQIDEAENGLEAVEKAREKHYDLIFMDQMMPHMNGMDAAEKIMEFSDSPIVLMTADTSDEMRDRCLNSGINDFLPKPASIEAVIKVVDEYIPKWLGHPHISGEKKITGLTDEANVKSLTAYARQLREAAEELPTLYREDLDAFRTKAHGIKGASALLGKYPIVDMAESMEMAAQTGHSDYIMRNMDRFISDISFAADEAEEECKELVAKKKKEKKQITKEQQKELLQQLLEGFKQYDVKLIEIAIKELSAVELEENLEAVLKEAEQLGDELEYEKGMELLKNYV